MIAFLDTRRAWRLPRPGVFWYFSLMKPRSPRPRPDPGSAPIRRIQFARHKYGPELLVDVDWVSALPGFIGTSVPHRLAFTEILLTTAGEGTVWLDDHRSRVEPNTVLFTSPGQVRRWQVDGLEGLCLFFVDEFIESWFADPLFLSRLAFVRPPRAGDSLRLEPAEARRLRERLDTMQGEIRQLRNDSADVLRAVLAEVLIQLNRWYAVSYRRDPDTRANPLILGFRRLVEEQVRRHHRLAWYAEALHVTPGHLNHLAHRHLGCPAGRFIRDRLIVDAKRLLIGPDLTAAQVARALGFRDAAYFGRFFRRETGRSPGRFRREV